MTTVHIAVKAFRTALNRAVGYLDVTHHHLGLHDHMAGNLRCEGCEILGDLQQVQETLDRAMRPSSVASRRSGNGCRCEHDGPCDCTCCTVPCDHCNGAEVCTYCGSGL